MNSPQTPNIAQLDSVLPGSAQPDSERPDSEWPDSAQPSIRQASVARQPEDIRGQLERWATDRQNGVILRSDANAAGLSRSQID